MSQRLIRNISGVVLLRCAGVFLAFLSSVVFARAMQPDEFGMFSYVTEIALLISLLATLGLPQAIMRAIASASEGERSAQTQNLVSWSIQAVLLSSLLFGSGMGLIVWLRISDPYLKTLFIVAVPIVALFAISQVGNAVLWGQKKTELSMFADNILRPGLLLAFAITAYGIFHLKLSAQKMVYLNVLAFSMTLLFLVRQVLLATGSRIANPLKKARKPFSLRKNLPFFFILLVSILNLRIGFIILGAYCPFRDVGYYKIAFTLSSLITFLFSAANMVIAPHIADLHGKRRPEMINRLTRRMIRPIFFVALVMFAIFILFGRTLLSVFYGKPFIAATVPLMILSCGQLFDVATGAINTVLKNTGNQRLVLIGHLTGLAVNVSLLLLLVPLLGAVGAAVATTTGICVCNTVNLILLRQHTEFSTSIFDRVT